MNTELGASYVDTPTGYVGVATTRNENLGGSVQIRLERRKSDGSVEERWVQEARLAPCDPEPGGNYA